MTDQDTQKIPAGWKISTFGELVYIIGGGTPNTSIKEYWNGDIPWISVADFSDDQRWIDKTERTITKAGLENSSTKLLYAGDLIISARGTVGSFAQLKRTMAFNQTSYGLKANELTFNDFLFYLLKFNIKKFQKNVHGAVFDTITRDTFDQIDILLPPLPEQRAIESVLSAFDDKIELLREQNKTLEAIAQTLFNRWFVEFNFPDKNGQPYRDFGGKMIDSELGEIPEGWKVGTLRDIVNIHDSRRIPLSGEQRAKRKGKYPYYGATEAMDYIDDYLFEGVYLLLAEDGSVIDENGFPVLQYVFGQFWVNNHAHVIQGKLDISTEYLYLLFKQTPVSGIITGAVQLKINQENLLSLEAIIPKKQTLKVFNDSMDSIFSKIRANIIQIQTLSQLRDTLLPKLMHGDIRTRKE